MHVAPQLGNDRYSDAAGSTVVNPVMRWIHRLGSPEYFYRLSGKLIPWFLWPSLVLLVLGLYGALFVAPPDYQQGESYRILFVHVPCAWLSLFVYMVMAAAAFVALVWRIKVAEITAMAAAPVGAAFTAVTLVTGMVWGKPMWGAYWVWDARLTSELVLLLIYLGVIGLYNAIDDRRAAARAASVLVLVGVVNIPIIHYSVEWWNTLHQGQTIRLLGESSIHPSMVPPLLAMVAGCQLYFVAVLLARTRVMLLDREAGRRWAGQVVEGVRS